MAEASTNGGLGVLRRKIMIRIPSYHYTRNRLSTEEAWSDWVESLSLGDKVLYQKFVPGDGVLPDRWRFSEGLYQRNRIYIDGDDRPIKDGYATFWNADSKYGDVFFHRIVPYDENVFAPAEGRRYSVSHAPYFEPRWTGSRCFALAPFGSQSDKNRYQFLLLFPHGYYREVQGAYLLVIFGDFEEVEKQANQFDGVNYLYSERLG